MHVCGIASVFVVVACEVKEREAITLAVGPH